MLHIEFNEKACAIADFPDSIEEAYNDTIQLHKMYPELTQYFSTENMISRFRLGVVRGEISHEDIDFIFNDEILKVNKYGTIPNGLPDGFCDCGAVISEEIMRTAMKMYDKGKGE